MPSTAPLDTPRRLETYEQLAERLATSPRHLRDLVYRREIPFVKLGALVRFDTAEVDAWIEARSNRGAA